MKRKKKDAKVKKTCKVSKTRKKKVKPVDEIIGMLRVQTEELSKLSSAVKHVLRKEWYVL